MIKWGLKKIVYFSLGWITFWTVGTLLLTQIILGNAVGLPAAFGVAMLSVAFGLAPGFLFYFLTWNILIKPGLVFAVKAPYVILAILGEYLVVLPLHAVGHTFNGFFGILRDGEENIAADDDGGVMGIRFPYLLLGLGFFIFTFWVFLPKSIAGIIDFATSATLLFFPMIALPVFLTVVLAGLFNGAANREISGGKIAVAFAGLFLLVVASTVFGGIGGFFLGFFTGPSGIILITVLLTAMAALSRGEQPEPQNGPSLSDQAGQAINYAIEANDLKNNSREAREMLDKRGASFIKSTLPGAKFIIRQLKGLPGISRVTTWLAGLTGGEFVVALLAVLILLVLTWMVVAIVFYGLVFLIIKVWLLDVFMGVAGPVVGVGDAAADWGNYFEQSFGGVTPNVNLEGEKTALRMAFSRVACAFEGPECMANMSSRPGSEAVGVEYGLEIEDFDVNTGLKLDIAGRSADSRVPFAFTVYNPIKNLKGVDARNVMYRISTRGGETVADGGEDQWGVPLGDTDHDPSTPGGYIGRGRGDRPVQGLPDLTLNSTGLLQPGSGIYRDFKLQVRYEYSSMATKQFEAMSSSYRRDQEIKKQTEKSKTADTPVKAYVNLRQPVTFTETGGGREPQVFPVFMGFQAGGFDVDYRVNLSEVKLYPSDALIDVDRAREKYSGEIVEGLDGSCEDLVYNEDGGYYTVNQSSSTYKSVEATQASMWYSKGFGPSQLQCDMIIDPGENGNGPLSEISATGETLTMRIDGNYTVRKPSESKTMEAWNTYCQRPNFNCPVVVPKSSAGETLESGCETGWRYLAEDGCTVVDPSEEPWGNFHKFNEGVDGGYNSVIDNGEHAYILGNVAGGDGQTSELYNGDAAVGLDPQKVREAEDNPFVIIDTAEGADSMDAEIRIVDRTKTAKQLRQEYQGEWLYINAGSGASSDTSAESGMTRSEAQSNIGEALTG